MLKLNLQYFGHLMLRANSLEKTLMMLGKIESRSHPTLQVRWPVPLLASPGWFQGYMQPWSHPDWMVHLIPTSDGWCQANRP